MNKPELKKVCFIGLGKMGWPMAARLVKAGFMILPADAAPGRASAFASEYGLSAPANMAEAAGQADAVITILPMSKDVIEAVGEIRDALPSGILFIEMSSGVPSITQGLAADLAASAITVIDAPVSGGVAKAKTGELTIMAGGEEAAIERAGPLLRAMGTAIMHAGGIGAGQAMKALNNLVSAGGFLIGVEALLIGKRSGLDPVRMVEILNASTGMNNSTQRKFTQFVLSRAFNSGFSLDLMAKDVSIALDLARDTGTAAPLAALCRELWSGALSALGPGQDHTAAAKFSELLAGISLEDQA
jgi:3-hydroxyisobutyrate dehydrogenase